MKSNLEETIAYYQKRVDFFQSQMDESIAEFDFDSAKAFTKHLFNAKAKLDILRGLKNPNYSKIRNLKRLINQIESGDYFKRFDFSGSDLYPEIRERQEQSLRERTEKKLQESKEELKRLLSLPIEDSIDDEKIIVLLEEIILNNIKKVELEIRPEKVYLELKAIDRFISLKIFTKSDRPITYYYGEWIKSNFENLGFEQIGEDFLMKRDIGNLRGLLELLSILMFEIFRMRSDAQINAIVYD